MDKPNDFRTIWLAMPVPDRRKLAKRLGGLSYGYLQRISGGFATPSFALVQQMKKILPTMDLDGFARAAKGAGKRMLR